MARRIRAYTRSAWKGGGPRRAHGLMSLCVASSILSAALWAGCIRPGKYPFGSDRVQIPPVEAPRADLALEPPDRSVGRGMPVEVLPAEERLGTSRVWA
jgi:hypothetical protein